MYLTHFNRVTGVQRLAGDLHRMLERFVELGLACRALGVLRHEALKQGIARILTEALRAHGCTLPDEEIGRLLWMDYELNAQGIGVWLDSEGS